MAAPLVRRELRITLLRRPFRLSHRVRRGVAGRAAVSCVSLAAPSKIPESRNACIRFSSVGRCGPRPLPVPCGAILVVLARGATAHVDEAF